ncbi:MAG: accessory factor UbiK family protein [Pseudomonadota bacterium]
MQSRSPLFSDLADLMTDAFGAAQAAGEEARAVLHARAERIASDLDLVSRDEFEALKAELAALREQNESLAAELAQMKAKSTAPATKKPAPRKRTAAKKSSG